MILKNKDFTIEICDKTGATTGIFENTDKTNWILENSSWGLIKGFETEQVFQNDNTVRISTYDKTRNIRVIIEKKVTDCEYFETYQITNKHISEVFLTKDNFGIPFAYDCLYKPERDFMNECCISHIWCGGDCAWIYSAKCSAKPPYLVMNVIEGAIDDYSIMYDISRTDNGSYYRGEFVLHLRDCALMPHESKTVTFRYKFQDEKPENIPLNYDGAIRFTANKYTINQNEEISLLFESQKSFKDLKISCEDKVIKHKRIGNNAVAKVSFKTLGEHIVKLEVDGKVTWVNINVILPICDLLQKRAKFITEKQQYIKDGSRLSGAYLVYDTDTKNLYYDSVFTDYNAGNERIGMGVLVCKALQEKYDPKMFESLKLHRAFVERELFDSETGMVYDNIGVKKEFTRIFNFPWVSTYYLEWYNLTGEIKCLENSAKILIRFFENTHCKLGAQCIEAYKICQALKKEGLNLLYNRLFELFICYVEKIGAEIVKHEGHINETSYCSEKPNQRLSYFSQAVCLTENEKYLRAAKDSLIKTKIFFAKQPDFHLNCINVRYWDRYWFGKVKSYGDVFPHHWSALAAWGMYWYQKATKTDALNNLIFNNLTGNLCVYREDGFAHNNFLYPYKIIQYSSNDEIKQKQFLEPGVFYGKNYDAFANDQDWALYYASCIL